MSQFSSTSHSKAWIEKIKTIQQECATPEVLDRIKLNAEIQRERTVAVKSASRIERAQICSMATTTGTLRSYKKCDFASADETAFMESTILNQANRSDQINGIILSSCAAPVSTARAVVLQTRCQQENDADIALNVIERELEIPFDENGLESTSAALSIEIDSLLEELSIEPTNDLEIRAKFTLFESFLSTVVAIRENTTGFWEQNSHLFVGSAYSTAQAEMSSIDSTNALGVDDDPRKWFVYSMTKKAHQNGKFISVVLAKMRTRLSLLSDESSDCPFCLDAIASESCTVLGCCHKVCSPCWAEWVALKGQHVAFCPLCKHREFLEEILSY